MLTLNLSNSGIGLDSAQILGKFIETNKILKHIDLSSNSFQDEGVNHIFQGLANNPFINNLEIDLFDNSITDKGAEYIYDCLKNSYKSNYHLSVSLWTNLISDNGLRYLIELVYNKNIKENKNITIEFQLQKNKLTEESAKLFFSDLELLKTIEYFEIGFNKIKSEGLSYLSHIKSHCPDSPSSFRTYLVNIKHLNLSHNRIGDDGLFHLANAFGKFLFAQNIILKENEITWEGIKYFANKVITFFKKEEKFNELKSTISKDPDDNNLSKYKIDLLDLSCNSLAKGTIYLANVLKFNYPIAELNLSSCSIGPVELAYLAQTIKKNTYLKKLDLSNNYFMDEGLKEFCEELELNYTAKEEYMSLKTESILDLIPSLITRKIKSYSSFEDYNEDKVNFITNISVLEEINLNHNKLNDESAVYLAGLIKKNKNIKKISVTFSEFTDKGIKELSSVFNSMNNLSYLNLSDCNKTTFIPLFKALNENRIYSNLKELILGHCNLLFDNDFFAFLKNCFKLKVLDLSYMSINDKIFSTCIYNLITNTNLPFVIDKLSFACNLINDEGIVYLVNAFNTCEKSLYIKELKLNKNKITNMGYEYLTKNNKIFFKLDNHIADFEFPIIDLKDNLIHVRDKYVTENKKKYINIIIN